jgi:hypothetical protein
MAQLIGSYKMSLKGFVLLEGIFAMIIIMICFGIATSTLNNIAQSEKLNNRVEARIAVYNLIIATKHNNSSTDTSYTVGRLIVRRTLLIRNDIPDCGEYVFTITDPDNSVIDTYHLLRYNVQEN